MKQNTTLFLITRFATDYNQRNLQLLNLDKYVDKIFLVHQKSGNRYTTNKSLLIKQNLKITSLLRKIGLIKIEKYFDSILYFPSPLILFIKPTINLLEKKIRKEISENRKITIISLLPPHELLLIGSKLKNKYSQINWIIDWQDLWTLDIYYKSRISENYLLKIKEIEENAFKLCDLNVVNNYGAYSILTNNYKVPDTKIKVIPHAFEKFDTQYDKSIKDNKNENIIRIGFLGSFYKSPKVPGEYILEQLLKLSELVKNNNIKFKLKIVGDKYLEHTNGASIKEYNWIEVVNRLSHKQSLKAMLNCDFLFIYLADLPVSNTIVHIKLPFYLMLGIPIIAIVPIGSPVRDIISKTKSGFSFDPNEDWVQKLNHIFVNYNKGNILYKQDINEIEKYSWDNVYQKWLSII